MCRLARARCGWEDDCQWREAWLVAHSPPLPLPLLLPAPQGRSRVLTGEPTLHTRTACMVAEALTAARFSISPAEGRGPGLWMLECRGAAVAAAPRGGC